MSAILQVTKSFDELMLAYKKEVYCTVITAMVRMRGQVWVQKPDGTARGKTTLRAANVAKLFKTLCGRSLYRHSGQRMMPHDWCGACQVFCAMRETSFTDDLDTSAGKTIQSTHCDRVRVDFAGGMDRCLRGMMRTAAHHQEGRCVLSKLLE